MEMNHALSGLPTEAVRFSRYETLVGAQDHAMKARCWRSLGVFWGVRDGLLWDIAKEIIRDPIRTGGRKRGRAAWAEEDAGFLDDLFLSEYAVSRWPYVHAGLATQPLCTQP